MKKIILLLTVCCLVLIPVEAKKKKDKKNKNEPALVLSSAVDSMSYALGVNIGTELLKNLESIPGGQHNKDIFLQGFQSSIKQEPIVMTNEFAQEYFQTYMMEAYEKESNAKKAEGEKFLADNKAKAGVHETPSGLQYIILKEGEGAKPLESDVVKVHYEGFLLDGTKFDSSIDRGEALEFPLNQVIRGWTEGVQLMPVGSKYKFFLPYELGYGERGAGNTIPPFSTLIFEIELLDINPSK